MALRTAQRAQQWGVRTHNRLQRGGIYLNERTSQIGWTLVISAVALFGAIAVCFDDKVPGHPHHALGYEVLVGFCLLVVGVTIYTGWRIGRQRR